MRGLCVAVVSVLAFLGTARAEEPAKFQCAGKVVGADGSPLEGVEVTAYAIDIVQGRWSLARIGQLATKADGAFAFAADAEAPYVSVVARKAGLALGWWLWRRDRLDAATITLGLPAMLAGTVVDEDGRPVAGAEVRPFLQVGPDDDRNFFVGLEPIDCLRATTDAQGRFVFDRVPADAKAEFFVTALGRAELYTLKSATLALQYKVGQEDIRIVLPKEAKVEGTVVAKADGKPVAGVRLLATPQATVRYVHDVIHCVSDAEGRFALGGLRAGLYNLSVATSHDEVGEWILDSPVVFQTAAGHTTPDVKVELAKGGLVEVQLTSETDGKPIAGADVGLYSQTEGKHFRGRSDDKGIARFRLKAGTYTVNNAGKRDEFTSTALGQKAEVAEGETTSVTVVLKPAPQIAGTAVDGEGKPVAGADIRLMPYGGGALKTDAEGKFTLRSGGHFPMGSSDMQSVLVVRLPDRDLAAQVDVDVDALDKPIEIKLRPATTFAGRVVDPGGKPLAGVPIIVLMRVANWGTSLDYGSPPKTDAEGRYEVRGIPAGGRYTISANTWGGSQGLATHGSAEAEGDFDDVPGGRVEVADMTLHPADCSLEGLVVDADDEPVSGAHVSVSNVRGSVGQPSDNTSTDADGKFRIAHLCKGKATLFASARTGNAYGNVTVDVDGDVKDVKVVLRSSTIGRPLPPEFTSLVGKPLAELETLGLEAGAADLDGKRILLCFWDWEQRPSRHMVEQLATRAEQLKEAGVAVILVRCTHGEQVMAWLEKTLQKNKAAFPCCGILAEQLDKTRLAWGVQGLPWLILTDAEHVVRNEGFQLAELDALVSPSKADGE